MILITFNIFWRYTSIIFSNNFTQLEKYFYILYILELILKISGYLHICFLG